MSDKSLRYYDLMESMEKLCDGFSAVELGAVATVLEKLSTYCWVKHFEEKELDIKKFVKTLSEISENAQEGCIYKNSVALPTTGAETEETETEETGIAETGIAETGIQDSSIQNPVMYTPVMNELNYIL